LTMKFATAAVLLALPAVSAFAPASRPAFSARSSSLNVVVTGPEGKAAASAEEDLELTYKVIMAHVDTEGDAVAEEPVAVAAVEEAEEETVDISIPYDAAAQLAYEASDKSTAFEAFKAKYEEDAVADVMAKYVDISIPYDAAARLAFESSDKSMAYADFKVKFEEDAVADVMAKYVDISIPYDAAARLAFESSDKSMAYADFKVKFEEDAVADVMAKYVDISIPYDAAARLAFESSDKSMAYADFKVKFEEDAVADVIAKNAPEEPEDADDDVSIPYDAAAQLAYDASDKSSSFDAFKAKYEEETVAMITAKKAARDA